MAAAAPTSSSIALLRDRFEQLIEIVTRSHLRTAIALGAVALAAFLPGIISIPPIDRDEARYAQASKQMMETGNYIDIRFQEKPRYLQPVGIYWLHVAAARLTGTGADAPIWVHRLPSLVGGFLSVLLAYWVALPLAGEAGAFIAAVFLAVSVLLGFEARDGKIDAVLLSTILGAIGFLARVYLRRPLNWYQSMLFWVALAAGILLKGPIILLVVGLTAATLCVTERSAAWLGELRPSAGFSVMLLLILPWFFAITLAHGVEFFRVALGPSMLGKVASGQQSHGLPPGTYVLLYWLTFWPAAALAIPAMPWIWRNRRDRAVRFCLAWIIPSWIVFELIVTKLPHYVLPVYPAVAILVAMALMAGRRPGPVLKWLMIAGALIYLALMAVPLYALERRVSGGALILGAIAVALFAFGLLGTAQLTVRAWTCSIAAAAILLHSAAFGLVIPSLHTIWVVPRVIDAIKRHTDCAHWKLASAGLHEPSLVFLAGTDISLTTASGAADFLLNGDCRAAIVEAREEPLFKSQLNKHGKQPLLRERVKGIAIGRVRRVDLGVFTISP